jgi:hypothetical protein
VSVVDSGTGLLELVQHGYNLDLVHWMGLSRFLTIAAN